MGYVLFVGHPAKAPQQWCSESIPTDWNDRNGGVASSNRNRLVSDSAEGFRGIGIPGFRGVAQLCGIGGSGYDFLSADHSGSDGLLVLLFSPRMGSVTII